MTQNDLALFIRAMRRELRIKYCVRVNLFNGECVPGGFDGWHRFNRRKHTIALASSPSRAVLDVLAHELCHAAVTERHGFKAAWHGEQFQKITREAIDAAARLGYKVSSEIFLPELDT